MKVFLTFAAIAFLAGCSTLKEIGLQEDSTDKLHRDIDAVLVDSLFTQSKAAILVKSLQTGEVLYEKESALLMRPASNNKLLTTVAALSTFGSDYMLWTTVHADTPIVKGTVFGNLYLKGFGNPDFKLSDLDTFVTQLKARGIRNVIGSIVTDETFFDDLYFGEGWMWDDEPFSYQALITPLAINDNCVNVRVVPGRRAGDSVSVTLEPRTSYVSFANTAKTVTDTVINPLRISRMFQERLNIVTIEGEMLAWSDTAKSTVTVWQPGLYAATLFHERLERDTITILGAPDLGIASDRAVLVAEHRWPIDSVLTNLNKESDNLSAENVLKTLGAAMAGPPGTARSGILAAKQVFASMGIDTARFRMVDGSGLSFYNLLTADMLVRLLEGAYQQPDMFRRLSETLPIAGVDGTLKNRMKGTLAEGNLRAKTGTISGVSSLSGYVRSADGEPLVFAMMMQNFLLPSRHYRDAQDKIGAILANFSRNANGIRSSRTPYGSSSGK
jgi:D-alanyl-D-alanine carboxypeptidase/D-alanyl-D-alanine-endopeptidase (penicillin-binding protein 4)